MNLKELNLEKLYQEVLDLENKMLKYKMPFFTEKDTLEKDFSALCAHAIVNYLLFQKQFLQNLLKNIPEKGVNKND